MPAPLPRSNGSNLEALAILLRYQWRSGVHLAWQVLTPSVVLLAAGLMLQKDQLPLLGAELRSGTFGIRVGVVLLLLAGLATAAPRIRRGAGGWMGHLPVREAVVRRSLALSGALALTPVGALVFAVHLAGPGGAWETLTFVPRLAVAMLGVGWLVPRVARAAARRVAIVGVSGSVLVLGPSLISVGLGTLLVALTGRLVGPMVVPPQRPLRWLPLAPELARTTRAGLPSLPAALALGGLPILAGLAFLTNNELSSDGERLGAILASGSAIAIGVTLLCDGLRQTRPPWGWARSLPVSSLRRVATDAGWLWIGTLPAGLAAVWLDPTALIPVFAVSFFAVALGALSLRGRSRQLFSSSGEVFLTAFLMAAGVALWPLVGTLVALAAAPVLIAVAAKRDRHLPIRRWHPRSHWTAGDALDGRA